MAPPHRLGVESSGHGAACDLVVGTKECSQRGSNQRIDSNKKSPQQAAGYWWSQIRTGLTACLHEFFCIPAPGFARTFLSSPRRRACQPYSRNTHPTKTPRPTAASSPVGTAEKPPEP